MCSEQESRNHKLHKLLQEFTAYSAAGWGLEAPSTGAASSSPYLFQPPETDAACPPQSSATDVLETQKCLGIVDDDDACAMWRAVHPPTPPDSPEKGKDLLHNVKIALRHAMATIAGCRIAVTVLQHSGWCLAALQNLETSLKALKAGIRNRQLWPEVKQDRSPEAFALKGAVKAIMSPFHTCLEILDDFPPPHETPIDPESVVYITANLDSMYYVLLDHHLTAKWPTPSVPPPHKYFPALMEAMGTEAIEAVQSLMQRGGPVAAASFRKAWELSESLQLPADVDPLRVVMWARWQEAAVLLFHRGLGTQGEIDEALEEEAGFKTWMANNSHRDSPAVDSPLAGDRESSAVAGAEGSEAEAGAAGAVSEGPTGSSRSTLGADPLSIGGVPTAELDQAIQAVLGAGGGELSDVDEDEEEDEESQLAKLAGLSLGASDADTATGLKPPPTAYTALQVFRETAREWPCHLYAFAAPNSRALKALAELSPIVEVGAGVGYWALLLKQAGVVVVATDELPTVKCVDDTVNKYHGKIPALTEVQEAPASVAAQYKDSTLFICYAPPDSSMAEEALDAYSGDCIAVVGEWDGDTGTTAFARSLLSNWELQEAIVLPNWSDTSHDLTIWRRKHVDGERLLSAAPWPLCSATGVTLGACVETHGRGLRRCRHLRSLLFSDKAAFEEYRAEAVQALALSFLFFKRPLQFDSNGDFDDVSIV